MNWWRPDIQDYIDASNVAHGFQHSPDGKFTGFDAPGAGTGSGQGTYTWAMRLDGCYAIKTDLPETAASKQVVHDRYKDLTEVEMAFRTSKTVHLEMRPVHVRTEEHTRGHVLAVMLAFLIRRELSQAWQGLNVTVEEGLAQLATLCSMEVKVEGGASCLRIPTPRDGSVALLQAASVRAPEVLPHLETRVVTRRTLPSQRKVLVPTTT